LAEAGVCARDEQAAVAPLDEREGFNSGELVCCLGLELIDLSGIRLTVPEPLQRFLQSTEVLVSAPDLGSRTVKLRTKRQDAARGGHGSTA
jgi:hypothetical protein